MCLYKLITTKLLDNIKKVDEMMKVVYLDEHYRTKIVECGIKALEKKKQVKRLNEVTPEELKMLNNSIIVLADMQRTFIFALFNFILNEDEEERQERYLNKNSPSNESNSQKCFNTLADYFL